MAMLFSGMIIHLETYVIASSYMIPCHERKIMELIPGTVYVYIYTYSSM